MNARFSASGDFKQLIAATRQIGNAMRQVAQDANAMGGLTGQMAAASASTKNAAQTMEKFGQAVTVHAVSPMNKLVDDIQRPANGAGGTVGAGDAIARGDADVLLRRRRGLGRR